MESGSPPYMSCILRLNVRAEGWESSLSEVLEGIRDVSCTIDASRAIAYVSGETDPCIILRIKDAGKHVQLLKVKYGYNPSEISSYQSPQHYQSAISPPYHPHHLPLQPVLQPPYCYSHCPPPISHSCTCSSTYPSCPYYAPSNFPSPYPSCPYYTPSGQYFPQSPPPPPADFNIGEPQCRIM
ncbi:extensin-2-like [Carica papaya]|uniref:extensin-2-like n=1 Tax=Carica papaya TaxID=3649 RepID=UPI000B8CDC87|nr:extensin-2-like [Carica papaya]